VVAPHDRGVLHHAGVDAAGLGGDDDVLEAHGCNRGSGRAGAEAL
jgi:hypothetical protein